jgi:tRNA(Ile)-lysidine synthase
MIAPGRLLLPPDIGSSRVLLGVSGGIDSMTLADLFQCFAPCREFAVATVNFRLRGSESDGDAALVRDWCSANGIMLFSTSFDTLGFAASKGISIEMAARELRYSWFDSLLEKEHFDYVAVAHNRNDNCETLMLNLLRGTGLRGACGMKPVSGKVIRPLLDITRYEIAEYASERNVPFREDSTNSDVNFSRNRIRNNVFPEFSKINPSFLASLASDMSHFSDSLDVLEEYFAARSVSLCRREGDTLLISMPELRKEPRPAWWLYRLLDGCNFDEASIPAILASMDSQPGALFSSPTHTLLRDREYFKVVPKSMSGPACVHDAEAGSQSAVGIEFVSMLPSELGEVKHPDLFMDAAKVCKPLAFRHWREGDRFRPFGMHSGTRKVSDFLVSRKVDRLEKSEVYVITDMGGADGSERILAVAGLEIDDRFKLDFASGNEKAAKVVLVHFRGFVH